MATPNVPHGIVPCVNIVCGHPTRSNRVKAANAPGTRVRCGQGLCSVCYRKRERVSRPVAGTPVVTDAMEQARQNATMRGFERFVAGRRARRVPVEGRRL